MMKKQANTTINIAETIANVVNSRDIVSKLNNDISRLKSNVVNLDFFKVEFVSRSAAHELLTLKEKFSRKLLNKKEIVFINANDDVKKMLRVVAMNRAVPEKSKPKFKAEIVSINSLLKA